MADTRERLANNSQKVSETGKDHTAMFYEYEDDGDYEKMHQHRVAVLNLKEKRDSLPDSDPLRKIIQEVISDAKTVSVEDLWLFEAKIGLERIARAEGQMAEDERLRVLEQTPAVMAIRQKKAQENKHSNRSPLGYRMHRSGSRWMENDEDDLETD